MTRGGLRGLLGVMVLWQAVSVRADHLPPVVLSGESRAAASRLAEARKRLDEKKWPEAIEELQGILNAVGDELVPLDAQRSLQARRLCHLQIATLPPAALAVYRNRVEPQARKWLEEATATNDPRLLRKIIADAFCSRAAEKALDQLGDLAFERGRFDEADSWWRLLSPLPARKKREPGEGGDLAYPDPQGDRARIEAKQLLARLFRGPEPAWAGELTAFAARHGTAAGTLAGRQGRYAAILRDLAEQRQKETPPAPGWTTFAGAPSRGLVVPASPDILDHLSLLCRSGPTWRFSLEDRTRLDGPMAVGPALPATRRARSLAFHPVLVGPYLLVPDAQYVTAHDLRTGESSTWYDAAQLNGGIQPNLKLPALPDLRYTLSVDGERVYARLGLQGVQDVRPKPKAEFPGRKPRDENNASWLVCLSATPGPGGDHRRWMVRAMEKEPAVFEGAPVVHDGFVYIAATRFEGDRNITAVLCYPADPEDSKPQLRWRQDVCETRELRSADERYRHHLLTLAGSLLVYCSHSGAIVALDAASGRRVWGVRYPRRELLGTEVEPPPRDLAPCLFAAGLLYVAPADSESLLCLDPATGQTLWERQRMESGEQPIHLLGVGHGKLIFTTRKGLHAVGAATGSRTEGWEAPHGGGGRFTMGRGLLLGDLVLWPTAAEQDGRPYGVFAVRQEDGEQPDNPTLLHRIPSGHLLYANGCLVVTDHETLSVFVPPGRRLEERQAQVLAAPKSAPARIELARSEADAGLTERALASFTEAERLAGREKPHLRDQARAERQVLLLETAGRAALEKRWSATEMALRDAVDLAPSPRARLDARIRAALIWQDAGQPARAFTAWQAILSTPELRSLQVHDPAGTPQSAGSAATQAIGALIEQHGRSFYEPFEKEARSLWDAAVAGDRPLVAKRLALEYPNATITRTALAEAARLYLQAKRPGAAAQAYRSLLALGVSGSEQAAALLGLARCCERQDCWEAARATWQRLANDHPTALLSDLAPNRTVRDCVSEHLRGPPFTTAPAVASLTLPLSKVRPITLGLGEFSFPVETCQAPPTADVLFTGSVPSPLALFPLWGELICRAAGDVRWRQALPFAPLWAGCFRDRVLVAGERGVACVRREDGERVWDFPAPVQGCYPSSRSAPVVVRYPLRTDPLTGFRLVGGRLFFVQGERLFALDTDNGKVLWHRSVPSPSGRFSSRYHITDGTVLVQTASARRWTLDAATGRLLHDAPTVRTPWPRPPLPVDEHTVCLVVDQQHLVLLDLATGQERWTYILPGSTTRSGEPALVVGDGHALLLVTPRNIGYELQRLDPATGKPSWPRSILLRLDRLEPAAWAVDAEAIYCVERTAVSARSLEDGRVLWERPLEGPAAARSLQRAGNYLLAYPAQTLKVRFQFHWLGRSVEWEGGPTLNEAGAFDVFCYDAKTGRVVQRCHVEAEWPRLRTRTGPSDPTRLLPLVRLGREPRTDSWRNVEVLHGSLRVAVGGQVWTLSTESKREKPLPR